VVTAAHEPFYTDLLSDVPPNRVIEQPTNKGTAPAILYSLLHVAAVEPTAAVAFFPSDHYFSDEERFMAHVASAFEAADLNPQLITLLGITQKTRKWSTAGLSLAGRFQVKAHFRFTGCGDFGEAVPCPAPKTDGRRLPVE